MKRLIPLQFPRAALEPRNRWRWLRQPVFVLAMSAAACGGPGSSDGNSIGDGNGNSSPPPTETPAAQVSIFVSGVGVASDQSSELATRSYDPLHLAASAGGPLYIADAANHVVLKVSADAVVTTLAGVARQFGFTDGSGAAARLNGPEGIALDASGNLLVADKYNHAIRRITPDGQVTTVAGASDRPGELNGLSANASFRHPQDVAVGPDGTIYVAEPAFAQVRSISPTGVVATFAGRVLDGPGHFDVLRDFALPDEPPSEAASPASVAVSSTGAVLASDAAHLTLRSLEAGGVAAYFAGALAEDGEDDSVRSPLLARFGQPRGIAVDASGNTYVADTRHCTIRRIAATGRVDTIVGRSGECTVTEGDRSTARLGPVTDLALAGTTLYAAIPEAGVVMRILNVDQATQVPGVAEGIPATATAQLALETRIAALASFGSGSTGFTIDPLHTAADAAGDLFIADGNNHVIQRLAVDGSLTTVAGTAGQRGLVDGPGSAALFAGPEGIALAADGALFVADKLNHRIRRVATDGTVSTVAGGGTASERDGPADSAAFQFPQDLSIDSLGNIYVAEAGTATVRLVGADARVTTLAGTFNLCGATDASGPAASFACGNPLALNFPPTAPNGPAAIATASDGTSYVADAGNHIIRKITTNGQVTTLAGRAGISGSADGSGDSARFRLPRGIAIDDRGDLYVADEGNCKIRKVTASGEVTTLVGMRDSCTLATGPLSSARLGARVNNLTYRNGTLHIAQNNPDTAGDTGLTTLTSTLLVIRGLD
ncbi:MAG: hypothetical protein KDG55_05865 [Rhodocyclaceae bacterium]|nr:hypothetical protein [Rhodocyclaceae bacterium]